MADIDTTKILSAKDSETIKGLQDAWSQAHADGNDALKGQYHAQAEAIRAKYGYSGGGDGTKYIPLPPPPSYGGATMPTQSSADSYIRQINRAQSDATLAALKGAYEQNVLVLDDAASRLPELYDVSRNRVYGESEIQRNAFNEHAAAQGLGSGAGTQVRLSKDNALLGNLASLSREEAGKRADLLLQKTKLMTAYNDGIATAKASGDLTLAKALYEDMIRVDTAALAAAKAQADEDYRAYTSMV